MAGLILTAASVLAGDLAPARAEATPKPAYRLGIFPHLPALTIDRLYGPLAERLSVSLDRMVKLRTKSTFENFQSAIEEQSYDVLLVHPFFFVDAVDNHDYLPLARLDGPLEAVLVTAEDSGIGGIEDLVDGTIGLPPKLAAVSKLIKWALIEEGLRPGLDVGIRHYRNKASCLQAVSTGAVAACGVPAFILSEVDAFASRPLRRIFTAPPVSHFAFIVHQRVPEAERRQLQDTILSLGDGGVEGFGSEKRFVRIEDGDYAAIRAKTTGPRTLAQR
ncbi:MAG: PhnD/SsuA/transferrin family substrate-binding protein [Pseudomonadota bacterium]